MKIAEFFFGGGGGGGGGQNALSAFQKLRDVRLEAE